MQRRGPRPFNNQQNDCSILQHRGRPQILQHNGFVKKRHPCPGCKYDFVCYAGGNLRQGNDKSEPHSFLEAADKLRQQNPKKGFGFPTYPHIPLLLECGHTVCENCIRKWTEHNKELKCPQCQTVHRPVEANKSFYELYPVNYYLLGILAFEKIQQPKPDVRFVSQPSNIAARFTNPPEYQNKLVADSNRAVCDECRNFVAESHCEQCKLNLCKGCFSMVHRPKCFNNHVAIPIAQVMPLCTVHTTDSYALEFFCMDCQFEVCRNCVITAHHGHKITEVGNMNKELKGDLLSKETLCRELKALLEHNLKQVESKLNQRRQFQNATDIEKQIDEHFQTIFIKLHLCENRIRNELNTELSKSKIQLQKIHQDLQKDHKTITDILNQISMVQNPKDLARMNIKKSLKDLDRLSANRKKHLVEDVGSDEISLMVDDDFLNSIDAHCSLDSRIENTFYMADSDNLPDGYTSPNVSDIVERPFVMPPMQKKEITRSNDSLSVKSLYLPKRQFSENDGIGKKPLTEGACVPVYLSHIKDPSFFYVQHLVDANNHTLLSNQYTMQAKKSKEPTPDEVEQNELYFVFFDNDKKYYRGRIRQIIKDGAGEILYDVYYIDYGNHKIVPITKLRLMKAEVKIDPPKAHLCSLYDIIPRNDVWTQDAIQLLLRMVNQSPVKMQIMKISGEKHYVDLLTIPIDSSDLVTSIRDALIILEHACFANPSSYNKFYPKIQHHENEFYQRNFSNNEVVDVECCHIIDPGHFYVQIVDYKLVISDLNKRMDQKYSQMGNHGMIYTPAEGMLCAVHDGNVWYRAKIIGIPGNKEVDLYLVDSGKTKRVQWDKIRILHEDFLKIHAQAIKCKLQDVESPDPEWSSESIIAFSEMLTEAKRLKIEVTANLDPKPVILYEVLDNLDRNLNAKLVVDGFGISTGTGSTCLEYHRVLPTPPKPKKIKSKRKVSPVPSEKSDKSTKVIAKKGEPIRVQVIVLSVISPGCVYVRLSDRNTELLELQIKMNKFYNTKSYDPNQEWNPQDKCAVCINKKWYRAIIESIDETAHVFIKDIAQTEEVSKKHLRVLDPIFLNVRDGSIKCELFGIEPAGGKTWPMLACEELRDLINSDSEVYITKRGDVTSNRSLPVDFWVQRITPGGALEASKSEWLKINQILIDKGLVMPLRNLVTEDVPEEIPESTDWVELADQELSSPSYVNEHWRPFEFLGKVKFNGVVTHVEDDLTIYLHDTFADSTLDKISTTLEFNFKDSKCQVEDMFWNVGCPCIANDLETGQYYRGIVKKVDHSEILVNCVDYGFDVLCRAVDLRKKIILSEIPIQAYKCQLYQLTPSPTYVSENEIDYAYHPDCIEFVRDTLLNETVSVKVCKNLQSILCIKLNDLIEDLIEKDWAMSTEDALETSDSDVIGSISALDLDSTFEPGYKLMQLPEGLKKMEVRVCSASDSLLTWYIRLDGSLAETLGKKTSYDELMIEIQSQAPHLPIIRNPEAGQACIALYEDDSNWYRGEILKPIYANSDTLFVIFTDFGNTEIVSRKNVKYVDPQWLKVPMQCLSCKLVGLTVNEQVEDFKGLVDEFRDKLYDRLLTAKIVELEPLRVQLYENGKLFYEDFIDKGLFIKV